MRSRSTEPAAALAAAFAVAVAALAWVFAAGALPGWLVALCVLAAGVLLAAARSAGRADADVDRSVPAELLLAVTLTTSLVQSGAPRWVGWTAGLLAAAAAAWQLLRHRIRPMADVIGLPGVPDHRPPSA